MKYFLKILTIVFIFPYFTELMAQTTIVTPYPETILLKQTASAVKERTRLAQGHNKYDRQPTGFYIEAGKKIVVNVQINTAATDGQRPVLTVGTLGFNPGGRNTGVHHNLSAGVNTINSAVAGLIYLRFITDSQDQPVGEASITFTETSEHVRAPRYVYGVTTDTEFAQMMDIYRTQDVIFHSDYAIVCATRESAIQYSLGENKNNWMNQLHKLIALEEGISGIDNDDPNPVHHRQKTGAVRHLLVENTSASPHANSGGYTGYPNGSRHRYLTMFNTVNNNSWMLGHEVGHQHQQPAYLINQATESTVNIYSYVVERDQVERVQGRDPYNRTSAARWSQVQSTYLKLPVAERVYDMPDAELESITGYNRDETRFMPWEQLFLIFGDEFYHYLHRITREEKVTGGGADERRFYLIWKASQITGYDMSEFFNLWGIKILTDNTLRERLKKTIYTALINGDIEPLPVSAEQMTLVTGQQRPPWTPLPLKGIKTAIPSYGTLLDIQPRPHIITDKLLVGELDIAYNAAVFATGDPTITWEITAGSLPDGIIFSEKGTFSGIPTKWGVFTFTVKATNQVADASKQFSITIEKGTGATVSVPTLHQKDNTSIIVDAAPVPDNGQEVEYAISVVNEVPKTGWQTTTQFEDLTPNTIYFIFARTKENDLYQAGVCPVSLRVAIDLPEGLNLLEFDSAEWTVTSVNHPDGSTHTIEGSTGNAQAIFTTATNTFLNLTKPGLSGNLAPPDGGTGTTKTIPADFRPYFIVDMKSPQTFNYFRWQHRQNLHLGQSRVFAVKLYGSDNGENFHPIMPKQPESPNDPEWFWIPNSLNYSFNVNSILTDNHFYLMNTSKSTYRYVKVEMVMWSQVYDSRHPSYPGTGANSGGQVQICQFAIGYVPAPPVITTTILPDGAVGAPYNAILDVIADPSANWEVSEGSLPAGLNIVDNKIEGTPIITGAFEFTLKATNVAGSDSKALHISIGKGVGAAVNPPAFSGATASSITIHAVAAPDNEQEVEYAINTVNSMPANYPIWQSSLTFVDLSANYGYYIFARSKENDHYFAGAVSASLSASTGSLTSIVETGRAPSLQAWTSNGQLHVTGLTEGKKWSVYTAFGLLVHQSVATGNEANIALPVNGVYIIQSEGKTVKVVLY